MGSQEAQSKYLVVEFPHEATNEEIPMAVISSKWTFKEQTYCYWPSYIKSTTLRERAVLNHMDLKIHKCAECPINVRYCTDDYSKANLKLRKLEEDKTSSDSSRAQVQRTEKIQQNRCEDFVYSDGVESDSSSLEPPVPPKLTIKPRKLNSQSYFNQVSSVPPKPTMKPQKPKSPNYFLDPDLSKDMDTEVTNNQTHNNCTNCKDIFEYCKQTAEILKKLTREIEYIRHDVKHIMQLNAASASMNNQDEIDDFSSIGTYNSLAALNTKLADENTFKIYLARLGLVGGKDYSDTTRRILMLLINNNLAKALNWSGRNKKNGLEMLTNIVKLLQNSVRKNPLAKDATNQEINHVIMNWFRNAKDREGGRKERGKKPAATEAENELLDEL